VYVTHADPICCHSSIQGDTGFDSPPVHEKAPRKLFILFSMQWRVTRLYMWRWKTEGGSTGGEGYTRRPDISVGSALEGETGFDSPPLLSVVLKRFYSLFECSTYEG